MTHSKFMPEEYNPNYMNDFDDTSIREATSGGQDIKDMRLARWQLDLTEMLDELCHHFRGDEYDHKENTWVTNIEYKLMNEKGIREVVNQLRMANRNIFLSNLTEDEIRSMMKYFMISFTVFLSLKWSQFEIDKKNMTLIKELVVFTLYPALKRSQLAGERKSLYQTQRVIESTITHPNQPGGENKGGILGKLFRRK